MKVCCDTTFLVDLSRGRRKARTAYKELAARRVKFYTTFLNVGELLAGVQEHSTDKAKEIEERFWNLLDGFTVLGVERSHIRKVGMIYGALHHRLTLAGRDIPASDKIIIATALAHDIDTFLTRDVEHYRRAPGITVMTY